MEGGLSEGSRCICGMSFPSARAIFGFGLAKFPGAAVQPKHVQISKSRSFGGQRMRILTESSQSLNLNLNLLILGEFFNGKPILFTMSS